MPIDPFELVRHWFQAFNAGDLEKLVALYHEDCVNDQSGGVCRGREAQRRLLEESLQRSAQRMVRMIARIEGGALHAEWRGREHSTGGAIVTSAGYDEFWIEDGLIRRQRGVVYPLTFQPDADPEPAQTEAGTPNAPLRPSREYPAQPMVGVGAVIVDGGKVVLVKRRFEPLAGQWSLPGGRLELGETLEAGLAREMFEETGLDVEVGPVVDVFDRILLDPERKIRYHYVLIDYLCRPIGGTLGHGSDVDAAELVDPADLGRYRLTPKATAVIERGLALAKEHTWATADRAR